MRCLWNAVSDQTKRISHDAMVCVRKLYLNLSFGCTYTSVSCVSHSCMHTDTSRLGVHFSYSLAQNQQPVSAVWKRYTNNSIHTRARVHILSVSPVRFDGSSNAHTFLFSIRTNIVQVIHTSIVDRISQVFLFDSTKAEATVFLVTTTTTTTK